jgi:hypothetical protein
MWRSVRPIQRTQRHTLGTQRIPDRIRSARGAVGIEFLVRPWNETQLIKIAYGFEQTPGHDICRSTRPPLAA